MQHKAWTMTPDNIAWATTTAKTRIKSVLDHAKRLKNDKDKVKRLLEHQCVWCFYSNRIAGQAFTAKDCGSCGEEVMYSSTDTGVLCQNCARIADLCKHCGCKLTELLPQKKVKTRKKINDLPTWNQ